MSELNKLSLKAACGGLKNKDFTSVELTQNSLDAIEKHNPDLNAYIEVTREKALNQAKAADAKIAAGDSSDMTGIPIGVKDLFCVNGISSTSCSHILNGFKPTYDSTVTSRLWNQDAVMLGKLNMDEFAMGSANLTSYYGEVKNPWGTNLVPGGSSGGSASAVAANLGYMTLGTDTGGSIRQPASFCGIVGMKPTYGRCSRWGIIAFASSLDQAGVLTRDVTDCAISLCAIMGHDMKDSTSANLPVPNLQGVLGEDIKGKKIGIPKEYIVDGMDEQIIDLWKKGEEMLKDAGAEIVNISLAHTKYALPAYYIIAPAEASSNLARYDGVRYGLRVDGESLDAMYENTRAEGFGKEVKRRIMIGTYVLSAGYYDAYYKKAQKIRALIKQDFDKAFRQVDAILTPTTPSAAFEIGADPDPLTMYLNDVFTVPSSLSGLPAISIPGGLNKDGLPLGLQIIGKAFDEEEVIRVAHVLEKQINFTHKPKGF